MMISPEVYMEQLKDAPYTELIKARELLIKSIRKFEKAELTGDRSNPEWQYCPSPDVQYQCNLEYLSELCCLMKERYNTEYVWGDRTLKEDAETSDSHESVQTSDSKKAEQDFNATLELMKDICKPGSNE